MKTKIRIILIVVAVLFVLFLPIPRGTEDGARVYQALTYKVVIWDRPNAVLKSGSFEATAYRNTSVYWIPNNFSSVDELWLKECESKNLLSYRLDIWRVTKKTVTNKSKNTTKSSIFEYDRYGQQTLSVEYDENGEETSRTEKHYKYDSDGRLIEVELEVDGEFYPMYSMIYDETGKRVKLERTVEDFNAWPEKNRQAIYAEYREEYLYQGSIFTKKTYAPWEFGSPEAEVNLSFEVIYNAEERSKKYYSVSYGGERSLAYEVYYDANGEELKNMNYDNGTVIYGYEYVLNESGVRTGRKTFARGGEGALDGGLVFDENGRLWKEQEFGGTSANQWVSGYTEYRYDSNGRMTEMLAYSVSAKGKETLKSRTEYQYDDAGNLLVRISYDKNGNVTALEENEWELFHTDLRALDRDGFEEQILKYAIH
jgi:RHS Repeat.